MQKKERLLSIDALRALVMLLMIFVNDLWTLHAVPLWLEHTAAAADGMGLADAVFPAFLFIVGLSIPFAIQNRLAKGHSRRLIFYHILQRSLGLLVIGFFHVNLERYSADALLPKAVWQLLLTVMVFLVWLDYANQRTAISRMLKACGIVGLLLLATVYQNAEGMGIFAMSPEWWGILGLIGWCYLLAASVFLWTHGKITAQFITFVGFLLFNIAAHSGWLDRLSGIKPYIWLVGDGSLPALSVAGILVSLLYTRYQSVKTTYAWVLLGVAVGLLFAGLWARQLWDLSKIRATPSFTLVCTGISMGAFAGIIWLTDICGHIKWYKLISPAGTNTLTCYLLPYIWYPLAGFIGWQLPLLLTTGVIGLVKSLLFALLIILLTGALAKKGIRLKL